MLNSSSNSGFSVSAHGNQRASLAAADVLKVEGFGALKESAKALLIEIKRRDATQIHAGWITMDELRASAGIERADLIQGLKDLLAQNIIESLPGNGQGNSRYRMLKKPANDMVEKAQKTNQSISIKKADEQVKVPVKDKAPVVREAQVSLRSPAVPPTQGAVNSESTTATPEKNVRVESAPQPLAGAVRGPRGHFVSRLSLSDQASSSLGASTEGAQNVSARSLPLPASNKVVLIQEIGDGLVLGLERRPGGTSIFISLDEAIEIGSKALELKKLKSDS